MSERTSIGIAVVEHDGRFLIGIRPEGVPLAGYAEFPGGKCRPEESSDACAIRECLEETGLTVRVQRLLSSTDWSYPHADVRLEFWQCGVVKNSSTPRPPFHWVEKNKLGSLRFPEANVTVVEQLMTN